MVADRKTDLADPTAALASYLDDLLYTATLTAADTSVEIEAEESVEITGEVAVSAEPAPLADAPMAVARKLEQQADPEPVPAPVVEVSSPEVEPRAETDTVADTVSQDHAQDLQSPPPVEPEGRPAWSEKPFECLIFRVAGLQLAVPLVLLGAIHRIEGRVKPIPGRPAWYMGMLPDRGHNLKVVDSAEWIMAGRVPAAARDGYRFVIRLDDSEWALACDEVAESFTLSPDEVRWRSARSKRPWLAGTVVRHMCALIDVGSMARLLAQAERDQRLELE